MKFKTKGKIVVKYHLKKFHKDLCTHAYTPSVFAHVCKETCVHTFTPCVHACVHGSLWFLARATSLYKSLFCPSVCRPSVRPSVVRPSVCKFFLGFWLVDNGNVTSLRRWISSTKGTYLLLQKYKTHNKRLSWAVPHSELYEIKIIPVFVVLALCTLYNKNWPYQCPSFWPLGPLHGDYVYSCVLPICTLHPCITLCPVPP